jgi:glutaminyl-tRNA synthetase
MYELAERLVREGHAYVCDLSDDQIKEYRGTLSEPGRESPFRNRSAPDSLARLRRMKAGDLPDGACTLRAKIDMASPNMKMRDPLLYRIRHAHHHRSGGAWCIYPMYDYAHPLEDAIEGITHSICTLEFENNRELYDWVLDHTGPWNPRPHQYEFARLQLDYTVMSKRKLLSLVQGGHVSGWDDPRMPTIAAMRRRGFSPEAIRAFADMIGVAKANSWVDIGKLEYCVRDDLNRNAPRVLGVLRPVEVELVGLPAGDLPDAPYFPPDVGKPGTRPLSISDRIYIERDDWRDEPPKDYQRLAPGRTVRLRYGYCITGAEVVARDAAGEVTRLRATVLPDTAGGKNPTDGRKVSGVIHWVDAATAVPAEVRLYDHLFTSPRPEDGSGDFLQALNPASLEIVRGARVEASMASAAIGSRWQLERVGYFAVDEDARPGALVLNRIVTLRESYAEVVTAHGATFGSSGSSAGSATATATARGTAIGGGGSSAGSVKSAKAKTRPKSKSPAEYRVEARARDTDLAAAFARASTLVPAESADLLTGDLATAQLFLAVAERARPETCAKWIINELPRALGESGGRTVEQIAASELGALLAAVDDGSLPTSSAKAVLAELVRTGKPFAELRGQVAAPVADLGAAIDAVIAANPDKAAQYKGGKTGLLGFFVGQVMKSTPGADAAAVNKLLRDRLG